LLFKLVLSLILALLAVLFVVQNVAVVEVRFLLWGLHMTLSLLIFLLFGCGIIVGWLMHSYWAYRRKVSIASEVRRDAAYEAEKNEPLPPGSGV
jgi:lipopolysaccharide assembly protein A